jgi:hypothetical protein
MGLYVEVMCDVRDETPLPGNALDHRCASHRSDNPQGHSIREARQSARKEGWKLKGGWACCPDCLDTPAGRAALQSQERT